MALSSPLTLVLNKTENELQALSQRLQKAISFVDNEKQQLQQLEEYESEYLLKISDQQNQWSAQKIHHYRSFCYQLNHAVVVQKQKITTAEDALKPLQQQVFKCRHKINVLEALIEQKNKEQQLLQDKQLQKEMDELSIRNHRSSPPR